MNTKQESYESKYVTGNGPKIKTVALRIAVTDRNLQKAVRQAFDLAL